MKCTDLIEKLHHITLPISESVLDESVYNGVGFDASSYKFSKVENSDMVLIPDLSTAVIDLFRERRTLSFFANIHLTDKERTRFNQDGRFVSQKVESVPKKYGIADLSRWGPEFEFYILSKV